MRLYFASKGDEDAVQCGSVAFQLTAMMSFIASITGCRSDRSMREASGKLKTVQSAQGEGMGWYGRPGFRNMAQLRLPDRAIQARGNWLKGQYALEFCQLPTPRPAGQCPGQADRDGRISRRHPA